MNEIWKSIAGFAGRYEVSNLGHVRSCYTGKTRLLSQSKNNKGYLRVFLCKNGTKKVFFVHRLVAEAFIPNLNSLETVNHKDENKLNNHVENLEWMTMADNLSYGSRIQKISVRVRQYNSDGTFIAEYKSIREASRETGVRIRNIGNGSVFVGGFIWKGEKR